LPVTGKDFINRSTEIDEILRSTKDFGVRVEYAISAPAGTGKTSLLNEIQRRLATEQKIIPVYFSLQNVSDSTVSSFIQKISLAILSASETKLKLNHSAKDLMQSPLGILDKLLREAKISDELRHTISLLLTFEREKNVDYSTLLEHVFMLPEKIAQENGCRSVLLLDEFTRLTDLDRNDELKENVLATIKNIHEKQEHTIYIISTSNQKELDALTLEQNSPFYHHFVQKQLKNFSIEATKELYEKNLDKKINPEALQLVHEFTQGSPFYLNFIGRMLKGASGNTITKESAQKVLDEFLSQEGEIVFREKVKQLSAKEKEILSCMAKNDVATPSDIGRLMNYSQTNVRRFLSILEEKGVVVNTSRGVFVFEDSIFKRWMREREVGA
jgi:AAA+ ATPase superfamily predicted ATPase